MRISYSKRLPTFLSHLAFALAQAWQAMGVVLLVSMAVREKEI